MMVVVDATASFGFFSFSPAVVRMTMVVVVAMTIVVVATLSLSCSFSACLAMVLAVLTAAVVAVQKLQTIAVAAELRIAAVANIYRSKNNRGSHWRIPAYLYLAIISSNSFSSLSTL